ncbi:hypothetical protein A2U01_0042744 [Trifolium medium]|uniref:NPH3 domain-containing protein n=1 Tax=Trifolium medium TaxID=97028 RepID=A0A392QE75_9FABA|nr:hypothetical protein [Trifolium medium]
MAIMEANTHAAKIERLPLGAVVQVLFSKQLKLGTSVRLLLIGYFASNNLDKSLLLGDIYMTSTIQKGGRILAAYQT